MSKNGFGSYGSISAPGGASGSSDPLSQGRVALATKSMGSRAQIQAIVPCVNQLLTSTLVDNIFKTRGIKISQVSVLGIIRQAEKTASYFARFAIGPLNLSRSASGLAEIKQSRRWLCFQWEYMPKCLVSSNVLWRWRALRCWKSMSSRTWMSTAHT